MSVERLTVLETRPYQPGFEQLKGVAAVAVDPEAAVNGCVVDIEHAARDSDGMVRFETDVVLIRPVDAAARGTLLHVVANRGRVAALPLSGGLSYGAPASAEIDPGDAFVLRHGMSVAWVGWQWDIERGPGVVGIDVPEAVDGEGRPLRAQARLEFLPLQPVPDRRLADEVRQIGGQFQSLSAADTEERDAVLTVRDWFNGPRRTIDRSHWRFARDVDGSPVADDEHVWLEGGFEARRYYEVTYTTRRCPVTGIGLLAVRDVVSYLRAEQGFDHVLSVGNSQSGRWLRQFILDTGNAALDGSRVFDGVLCNIAGGRLGEFNNRSAQPSTMNPLSFTHLPPFSPEDGLLEKARHLGTSPRTIFANSATEYWRGDASLVHTDEDGRDLQDGEDWRAYLYAGAHHAEGVPEQLAPVLPVQLGYNPLKSLWSNRAHLVALDEWVRLGRTPPPSEVPRIADGTAVTRDEAIKRLADVARFSDVTLPDVGALLGMPPIDLGPGADDGVGRFPAAVLGPSRPCVVAAIDDDGNEVAGIRLPEVAVPLAAYCGWNAERPRPNQPVEVWNLLGGSVPFGTEEILRRYGTRDAYLERVRRSVDELVARRHLLAEDAAGVVDRVGSLWDRAFAGEAGQPG